MKKRYMNPYMAGTMLGIVLLLAIFWLAEVAEKRFGRPDITNDI